MIFYKPASFFLSFVGVAKSPDTDGGNVITC
jgi:hypothetical protein